MGFPWWEWGKRKQRKLSKELFGGGEWQEMFKNAIWQGTVWEQNAGMSQEEQLQEINKGPDWSRLALNTGECEFGS